MVHAADDGKLVRVLSHAREVFGNFNSGYCLLREQKIMIVNKFFTTEGKINALLEILKNVVLDTTRFSEKNVKLYEELTQSEVKTE